MAGGDQIIMIPAACGTIQFTMVVVIHIRESAWGDSARSDHGKFQTQPWDDSIRDGGWGSRLRDDQLKLFNATLNVSRSWDVAPWVFKSSRCCVTSPPTWDDHSTCKFSNPRLPQHVVRLSMVTTLRMDSLYAIAVSGASVFFHVVKGSCACTMFKRPACVAIVSRSSWCFGGLVAELLTRCLRRGFCISHG